MNVLHGSGREGALRALALAQQLAVELRSIIPGLVTAGIALALSLPADGQGAGVKSSRGVPLPVIQVPQTLRLPSSIPASNRSRTLANHSERPEFGGLGHNRAARTGR